MLLPADRRRLLGAFVRSRREALPPRVAGGAAADARACAARRWRELCGISAGLVQLDRAGPGHRALRRRAGPPVRRAAVDAAERAYLFELSAAARPRARPRVGPQDGRPGRARPRAGQSRRPAYLLDRRWRALAWNDGGGPALLALARRPGSLPAAPSCSAIPGRAHFIVRLGGAGPARHRGVPRRHGPRPEDPAIAALVAGLPAGEPRLSRACGTTTRSLAREGGARLFRHPEDGLLRLRADHACPHRLTRTTRIVMLLPTTRAA